MILYHVVLARRQSELVSGEICRDGAKKRALDNDFTLKRTMSGAVEFSQSGPAWSGPVSRISLQFSLTINAGYVLSFVDECTAIEPETRRQFMINFETISSTDRLPTCRGIAYGSSARSLVFLVDCSLFSWQAKEKKTKIKGGVKDEEEGRPPPECSSCG